MENKLWQDILAQPENMKQVVRHLLTEERVKISEAAACLDPTRPIAMIGIGSAAYLSMPAAQFLNQNGWSASIVLASDAYYNRLPAMRYSNVIINSRSGETIEILKLGQALAEAGIPFIAITNEPDSTLARLAKHTVWTNTRKDELVSINVVTAMMTATLALAAAALGRLETLQPGFERLAIEMRAAVSQAVERAEELGQYFSGVRPIYLLYRGASEGSAFCGRLVLEEVARWSAIAMEAGDFRHGPVEVVDERFGAVLFLPDGEQGQLNRSLGADLLKRGGRVLFVGHSLKAGSSGGIAFPIEAVLPELRPVLEVVPVQVLAYRLAMSQGYTPGEVRYITKVITQESSEEHS